MSPLSPNIFFSWSWSKANSRLIGPSQWRAWSIWPGAIASHCIMSRCLKESVKLRKKFLVKQNTTIWWNFWSLKKEKKSTDSELFSARLKNSSQAIDLGSRHYQNWMLVWHGWSHPEVYQPAVAPWLFGRFGWKPQKRPSWNWFVVIWDSGLHLRWQNSSNVLFTFFPVICFLRICPAGCCLFLLSWTMQQIFRRKVPLDYVINLCGLLLFALFLSITLSTIIPFLCQQNPDGSRSMVSRP